MDRSFYIFLLLPPLALFGYFFYRSLNRYAGRKGGRKLEPRQVIVTLLLLMTLLGAALMTYHR